MSTPLLLAALWVIAATFVAFMPMKYQRIVGLPLLVAAPVLIVWIGIEHGGLLALAALAAFVSMFRKPLMYFWHKARGELDEKPAENLAEKPTDLPKDDT